VKNTTKNKENSEENQQAILTLENRKLRLQNGWVQVRNGEIVAWPKKADAHQKAPDLRGDCECPCCNTRLDIALWLATSGKVYKGKLNDKLARQLEYLDQKETPLPHDERK